MTSESTQEAQIHPFSRLITDVTHDMVVRYETVATELSYLLAKHRKNGFQCKGEVKGMEVSFCFDDDNAMRCYLKAKHCLEVELGEDLCHYEAIGRLAEFYLDVKKGEKDVYDTDEVD